MTDARPSPDDLLKRIDAEEARARRGKLTVFFGAAPGVGKTYAMLEAAREERRTGVDVVAGVVVTHGREETEALVEGLTFLPTRRIEYRGVTLEEFDLDAALARHPSLLLVDELAHTNAPGSRHAKRWQDVEELIAAGIDVFTTLNVQHVESLKDVVGSITGVTVRETVPDSVLESADEIRLVDLPPDELLERLRDGKVYLPAQAQRATESFFRKGNLIALREIALRRTAERVDAQMRQYRAAKGIEATWAASERILVCLSWSPHSARVLRDACRMATSLHAPWLAVYVEPPPTVRLSEEDRGFLAENLRLATQLGAEVVRLAADRPAEAVVRVARERNVTKIVVGKPRSRTWRERFLGNFVDALVKHSGDIDIYVTAGGTGDLQQRAPERPARRPGSGGGYLVAAAIVALTSGVNAAVFGRGNSSDVVMLYLLGVVLASLRLGSGPSLFAALLSVLAFDVLFIPPYFSLAVTDLRHLVTFGVMLFVAVVISGLVRRVRAQADATRARERHTAALYELSRELARAADDGALVDAALGHVARLFVARATVLAPRADGELEVLGRSAATPDLDPKERGVARWVWLNGREAGRSTRTLPGAEGLYLPLSTAAGRLGVLGIVPADPGRFDDPEERQRLEAFAAQMAIVLERLRAAAETQRARLESERERLRNALLSSVSHDLRTPLTSIEGAATTLLERDAFLDAAARRDLLETVREEALRLNRRVANLLDMTRIEAGAVEVRKEWQPVEEVIGAALNQVDEHASGPRVRAALPDGLPLVPLDTVLIEQVLVNLIENALKFSGAGQAVELAAAADAREVTVTVGDRGPGIPPGEEERIFERFHRAAGSDTPGGAGLGLAICRAIVNAHGGRIWAENRVGGGAVVAFTLPLEGAPPAGDPQTHGSA